MLMAWHQIVGNKNINGLIAEGYRSINTDQIFQFFCLKARFLLQFPVRTLIFGFSGIIQLSYRDLQSKTIQCVSVLAHHEDFSFIRYRQHCRSSVMVDIVPMGLMAVGKNRILVNL